MYIVSTNILYLGTPYELRNEPALSSRTYSAAWLSMTSGYCLLILLKFCVPAERPSLQSRLIQTEHNQGASLGF